MRRGSASGVYAQVSEHAPPKLMRRLLEMLRRVKRLPIIITAAAAAAVVLLAFAVMGTEDIREYRGYMDQAERCVRSGDYDSALSCLRKAAAIDSSSECVLLMADCYQAQENYEKALSALNLAKEPDGEVRSRITEIERLRARALAAEKLNIAGKLVAPDAEALVLDGVSLKDGLPEELLRLSTLSNFSAVDASLSDISVLAGFRGLVTLNLSGNNIKDISPLAELTGLRSLYLDNNPIEDFSPLMKLTKLTTLSIRGMDIAPEMLESLSLTLPDCAIYSDDSPEDAVEITLGGISFRSDVRELDLSGTGIRDISALSRCRDLKRLNLSGNKILDISPLVSIPSLEWLDVSYNELSDLNPLIGISTLRTLYAQGNRVRGTAAVGAIGTLTELDLSENPIEDFSGLKKLRNLKVLLMKNSQVTDEGISYLEYISSLTRLELDRNPDIGGEAVKSFQLAVPGCTVIHSALVYPVEIGGQSVRADAEELYISCTGTADLSALSSMECLKKADFSGNGISNIYIFRYSGSRFTLEELDLSNNALEDITPVSWLSALEELDLSGNNISSVQPLMGMTGLRRLNLKGNPISEEQLEQLRTALTSCEIEF